MQVPFFISYNFPNILFYNSRSGLQNLEASLPSSVMEIKVDESLKVSTIHDHSPEARREKVLKDQLEKMNSKLVERKEKQNQVKPPLKYAVKIEKPPARPPTPTIYIPYVHFYFYSFSLTNFTGVRRKKRWKQQHFYFKT